ncbi:hypothetical protein SAMN05421788_11267 [Filimonas lacunae]|uniref:Uncharacterized protein n=1 Tax=Filimonas lacunae TaxID=477680 RepID=A0A173MKU7_9BACT|nr:hypothetical protein [Filimonas lacunae]BAV08263.1 hypothetical protein FLA_4296 [Filimonas lacunae]SIT33196.1 hypothetical protein SAMN05421788_11267 [Filimonas lacunae]
MLNQSEINRPVAAEITLLKELEARYAKAIQENEAFVLVKQLYMEIKHMKEKLQITFHEPCINA